MFQEELINWYEKNKRPLIFRQQKKAYNIWISEIMAQQTRIEAMLPYYERFIQELPDLPSLACVPDEKLYKLWEGLGYYSRCRNLKKCAIECMHKYDGKLPDSKDKLIQLPGIGPYTAGAIASIAYDENVSAIDGNVMRVFSRLYDYHEDLAKTKNKRELEQMVDKTLPGSESISSYNQALMELGALICIPKNPRCESCPIQKYCMTKDPSILPVITKKTKRRIEKKTVYIWVCENKIHIQKREQKGLLHGLYGFDEVLPKSYESMEELKPYNHIFSHVEWHMQAYMVKTNDSNEHYKTIELIDELYAIPGAFQPFYQQVKEKL